MDIRHDTRAQLSADQYVAVETAKSQIVLHHTVSSGNPFNVVHGWRSDNRGRVATSYIIAGREDNTRSYADGSIYEVFSPRYWAWSINANVLHRAVIERRVIGIELCNYGQLSYAGGKFYALSGKVEIPSSEVIDLGYVWRGSRYYHAYTSAQLQSLRWLLLYLGVHFSITMRYNNLFIMDTAAIGGVNGIWGHCNYRLDKSDVSPQPHLISLLQSI